MKIKTSIAFILVSLIFITGCNGKKKGKTEIKKPKQGIIIESVTCLNDCSQRYSLYVPSYYSDSLKWPVIFAFDAHGNGSLPVNLFKDDAEKYGYILIGSNISKNGTPWTETSAIYDSLLNESRLRFSVDENRIYTCGFSGGSRVASTLALTKKNISGVIGCGAGFSAIPGIADSKFDYLGVAGNKDFNKTEMVQMSSILDSLGFRNYLIAFNGKHEWPPKHVAHEAILWLELNAMKDNKKNKNNTLINTIQNQYIAEYKNLINIKKSYYNAYLLCCRAISYLKGLGDISFFIKEKETLSKTNSVVIILEHLKEIEAQETILQNSYTNALALQSELWWEKQTTMLFNKTKTGHDTLLQNMYSRILSYLSLAAYMNASAVINSSNFPETIHRLNIYGIIDPGNPEYAYLLARIYVKINNKKQAITNLKKAVLLGFEDGPRLDADTVLQRLQQENDYKSIRETIENKKKIK